MRLVLLFTALLLGACHGAAASDATSFDGVDAKDAAALVAHGARVATLAGCTGCHGDDLRGRNVTAENPDFGDMNAPNLTLLISKYDDAGLDRAIRKGVPLDGRGLWFMPTESLQSLSDADMQALTAYLRTLKPDGQPMPPIRIGPALRKMIDKGEWQSALDGAARFRREPVPMLDGKHPLGRYVAQVICAECHNSKLQGYPGDTPDLHIAGAYGHDKLVRLLTDGTSASGRDLGLMTKTGQHRLSRMTAHEREETAAYILAFAAQDHPH